MKKITMLFTILFSLFFFSLNVKAEEYIDNITIRTAIDTSLNKDDIDHLKIVFQTLDENDLTSEPKFHYAVVNKDEGFQKVLANEIKKGNLHFHGAVVGIDVASLKYDVEHSFTKIDEDNYILQLNVLPHNTSTSSTANKEPFNNLVIEQFMTEEEKTLYKDYIEANKTTTTTTNASGITTTQNGGTSTGDPDIIIGEGTTTQSTKTTKSEEEIEEEKRQKEKEKRIEKEDKILKVMLIILGTVILIGLLFASFKIYQASKMV